jgi:hypothetical protein
LKGLAYESGPFVCQSSLKFLSSSPEATGNFHTLHYLNFFGMKFRFAAPILLVVLMLYSCSVLRKDDNEKEIREFIASFQSKLTQPDDIILDMFDARQSRDIVMTAVRILQNKEHEFILCEPAYGTATIIIADESISVNIPVMFRSQNLNKKYEEATTLVLYLKRKKNSFVITKLDADAFYQTFARIKNDMQWQVEREREYLAREPVYALARNYEASFDSVFWYTRYESKTYFYVVAGQWENWFYRYEAKRPPAEGKVGLLNEAGEVIMPLQYDLVGTIGFDFPGLVEVNSNGKYGYFDVENRKLVVPVEHDILLPYKKNGVKCIVKTDTVFGYYSDTFEYKEGFPDDAAERWVKEFKFVPSDLHLDVGSYALAEIPDRENAGYGIVVMPSYLVKTGVFEEVVGGISPTDFPINGYTDYVETNKTVMQTVSESISALVTTIKERYLDGREEFYTHNSLVFVGKNLDTLSVTKLYSGGDVSFRVMDSLLEVKSMTDDCYFYEGDYEWDDVAPSYTYFILGGDLKVTKLSSKRNFSETEFARLDSTYLSGDFKRYDPDTGDEYSATFFSLKTVTYMRDEILASYGVKYKHESGGYDRFSQFKDVPEVSASEARSMLSLTDAHNVAFLERMIDLLEPASARKQNVAVPG